MLHESITVNAEAADFGCVEAMYWAGEMCRPEYARLRDATLSAMARAARERYGAEHAAEIAQSVSEYRAELDRIRQAPIPHLCRVPGCECE